MTIEKKRGKQRTLFPAHPTQEKSSGPPAPETTPDIGEETIISRQQHNDANILLQNSADTLVIDFSGRTALDSRDIGTLLRVISWRSLEKKRTIIETHSTGLRELLVNLNFDKIGVEIIR